MLLRVADMVFWALLQPYTCPFFGTSFSFSFRGTMLLDAFGRLQYEGDRLYRLRQGSFLCTVMVCLDLIDGLIDLWESMGF